MIFCCMRTHWAEKLGLSMVILGTIVMMADPHNIKDGEKVNWVVDLIALCFSFSLMLFMIGNNYLKQFIGMPL